MTHSSIPASGSADDTLESQYGTIDVESGAGAGGESPLGEAGRRTADTAGQLAERAANTGIQQVDRGREQTAEGLTQLASSLRRASDEVAEQAPFMQNITQTIADQTERAAAYLRETDARQIVRNVEDIARRQPLVFLGGAFLVGLVGARVLKMAAGGQGGGTSYGGSRGGYGLQAGYGGTSAGYETPSGAYGTSGGGYGTTGSGYGTTGATGTGGTSNTGYGSMDTPITPAGSTEI